MKRVMVLLSTFVFMLGVSGQAYADFTKFNLIRVVYDSAGSMEQITDLGAAASQVTSFTNNINYTANPISFSRFGSANSNLMVAYYVWTQGRQSWISGPTSGSGTTNPRRGPTFNSVGIKTRNGARVRSGGTGNAFFTDRFGMSQSYSNTFDFGGDPMRAGFFAGFTNLNYGGNGEANLGALDTVGYVDQALYYFSNNQVGRVQGLKIATIRTYANGTTQINAVPLPAAVYLFGTGLLGLVGVRRKMGA